MLRTLMVLLLGLLLFAGSESHAVEALTDATVQTQMDGADDCCPLRPGQTDEQGDCCDFDRGQCCATGTVAPAPNATATVSHPRASAVEFRGAVPPELLRTRSTGPPPLPPPIG
jgi:hypothetical protein